MPINDPIAWWKLNDGSGTTAKDSSGNGFNGTLVGTPNWVAGQVLGGLSLDGATQSVNIPFGVASLLSGGSALTMAIWFKGTKFQSAIRMQPTAALYALLGFGDPPTAVLENDGGVGGGVAIAGVQDGAWHHVAMTWAVNTANGFKVYIDGALSAQRNSSALALPTFSNDFPARLGSYAGFGDITEPTNGIIDEARIYTRALTAGDVTELFSFREAAPFRLPDAGSGTHRQPQQLPYWWHSYFEQLLDEFDEREQELRRQKKIADELAAQRRFEEAQVRIRLRRQWEQQQATEAAAEQARTDARLRASIKAVQDERAAGKADTAAQIQAALDRVEARKRQAAERAEEDELQRLRGVVRSRRPFAKRFETAIDLLKRQGWRAKDER